MKSKTKAIFREVTKEEVSQVLEEALIPELKSLLLSKTAGHCMRIGDLDRDLILQIIPPLRKELDDKALIFVLGEHHQSANGTLYISSTKLVELRNPYPDGSLRFPLLVFIPPNTHASAEDSFGVATFEEVNISHIYDQAIQSLLTRIPGALQGYVKLLLEDLSNLRWVWANPISQIRFLLTAQVNGIDAESIGAALYELGLTPDFQVFKNLALTKNRLDRNLAKVRSITYSDVSIRGRVLNLNLSNQVIQRRLMQLLLQTGVHDPKLWAREIALDSRNWDISFDKWSFSDELVQDKVLIQVLSTDLPQASDKEDSRLQEIIGEQYLAPKERKKFSVNFEVTPHPSQIRGLSHFSAQVFYQPPQDDAPPVLVGLKKTIKVWKARRTTATISFSKLDKIDFDEGWHFVRVLPWTDTEDPIPLESPPLHIKSSPPNESEWFYVIPNEEFGETPPQRAVQIEQSLEHARVKLQLTALSEKRSIEDVVPQSITWKDKTGKAAIEYVNVKFGKHGAYNIPVSSALKKLEQKILSEPEFIGMWEWQVFRGEIFEPKQKPVVFTNTTTLHSFLAARQQLFQIIYADPNQFICQATDFQKITELCLLYGAAYYDLIADIKTTIQQSTGIDQIQAIGVLRSLLSIDNVHVLITDYLGNEKEALLVSPTHPLRIMWLATWSQLTQMWIEDLKNGPADYISVVREAILQKLLPLHIPVAVPSKAGKVFVMVDNLNTFWGLYASPTESDLRGLIGAMSSVLNIQEPGIEGGTITDTEIAARIHKYLIQHPYVNTLNLNVFNPGRASIITSALEILQKQPELSGLRYNIRLFTPQLGSPLIGDAFNDLLNPNSSMVKEEIDAFSRSSGNPLYPKLNLAILSSKNFFDAPEKYRAHLSILLDLFPAAAVGSRPPFTKHQSSSIYGLNQEFETRFMDREDVGTIWIRQPKHGIAIQTEELEEFSHTLSQLAAMISGSIATVATSKSVFDHRPVFTLGLNTQQRQLIHLVHDISDWVITIDRNMGVEFYDHGGQRERPDYLIDFVPGKTSNSGHKLFVTTRSTEEIRALLEPVFKQYGIHTTPKQTLEILKELRSLSGRLALKLASSTTSQAEVVGLILARLFLKYQKVLQSQIIVPLDDWVGLFYSSKRFAEELGESLSISRADIALFDVDKERRVIQCNLIEVKCYRDVGGVGAFVHLKETISEQLNLSETTLRQHFDPLLQQPDRPDRAIKSRELANMLVFYLDRSLRYQLIGKKEYTHVKTFLETLEEGFKLEFTGSALIFDFEKPGTEEPEIEAGITYYRLGIDIIRDLFGSSWTEKDVVSLDESSNDSTSSIPILTEAPFISKRSQELDQLIEDKIDSAPSIEQEIEKSISFPIDEETSDLSSGIDEHIGEETVEQQPTPETSDNQDNTLFDDNELKNDFPVEANEEQPFSEVSRSQSKPAYDVLIGSQDDTPQYGILGEVAGRKVALDLNQTHTISLFGVQGSGKSYSLGSIIEMACLPIPNINHLPEPLATILFHYSTTEEYKPEFTSMAIPNTMESQVLALKERYGASPQALENITILVPESKVDERKAEYPDIEVLPIQFSASELKASHWKFLMGAVGSQSMYLRQVNFIMRKLRDNLTLNGILNEIENSTLSDHLKDLARTRLQFAAEYVRDEANLTAVVQPGRLIIVDLRDEFIEKDEALGLFVVMLQMFSEATQSGKSFNKLVVFDEAHKYIENQDLISGLIEVVREMRHKGTSVMVASQEPRSVPVALIELSTEIILHRFNSPDWLKHVQKANTSLSSLTAIKLSHLNPGEAYIWSSKATDSVFNREAVKMICRPRVTQHGGSTKTAVEE
jgi:hypothetical protein